VGGAELNTTSCGGQRDESPQTSQHEQRASLQHTGQIKPFRRPADRTHPVRPAGKHTSFSKLGFSVILHHTSVVTPVPRNILCIFVLPVLTHSLYIGLLIALLLFCFLLVLLLLILSLSFLIYYLFILNALDIIFITICLFIFNSHLNLYIFWNFIFYFFSFWKKKNTEKKTATTTYNRSEQLFGHQ